MENRECFINIAFQYVFFWLSDLYKGISLKLRARSCQCSVCGHIREIGNHTWQSGVKIFKYLKKCQHLMILNSLLLGLNWQPRLKGPWLSHEYHCHGPRGSATSSSSTNLWLHPCRPALAPHAAPQAQAQQDAPLGRIWPLKLPGAAPQLLTACPNGPVNLMARPKIWLWHHVWVVKKAELYLCSW